MKLSHCGLCRLSEGKEFFLKSEGSTLRCSKNQIKFLSPKIYEKIKTDRTLNIYELQTPKASSCFDILNNIINGLGIEVEESKICVFDNFMIEFGNEELISFNTQEITKENIFNIIYYKKMNNLPLTNEIEFISSHFYDLDLEKLSNLDITILESVLFNNSLVINSESELLSLILSVQNKQNVSTSSCLIGCIQLEYLNELEIMDFISLVNQDNIISLWPSISQRLKHKIYLPSINDSPRYIFKSIPFAGNNFEGIISYLWNKYGENPLLNGKLNVEINYPISTSKDNLPYIFDPEKRKLDDWACGTTNNQEGYFIFDFKDMKVKLTGYSLMNHGSKWFSLNGNYLLSWKL